MAKFIKLTNRSGIGNVIINVDEIVSVIPDGLFSTIRLKGGRDIYVWEESDEVADAVLEANE